MYINTASRLSVQDVGHHGMDCGWCIARPLEHLHVTDGFACYAGIASKCKLDTEHL